MTYTVLYRVFVARKKQGTDSDGGRNVISSQNANRMSTLSPLSDIKLCPFDASFKTNSQYICYKYEKCCRQGCCSNYGVSYYQSWTFWTIIGIIFGIFYLGSWYCKKVETEQKRRLRENQNGNRSSHSSVNSSPQASPRRRTNEENVDQFLDYIIHSYRLQSINETSTRQGSNVEPPPKYQEALSMPKLVRTDTQNVQVSINDGEVTCQVQSVSSSSEVPPTYEDALQNSKEADQKNV